jgi:LPS-assembly protein
VGLHYSPGPYRTLSTAYRLKREESEQLELGWQWPVYGPRRTAARQRSQNDCSGSWYSVGRVSYSLRDSRITDSVLGFEYDAGCWIGRVVAKRLSTNQAEATTQLGFEIEFVGLSRLGTNPLKVLKDNIPGYRLLRDDAPLDANRPIAPVNTTP